MKKNLRLSIVLAAFFTVICCIGQVAAQPRIVGGFRETSKTDADVTTAANFAVKAQNEAQKNASLKLISIERAERQIVAGSNYRLCLVLNSGGNSQQATAVVYHDLQNNYSLTSWTPGNCSSTANAGTTTKSPAPALAPDAIVRNLYAAHKAGASPFFQTKNRAVVDKYFTKDFADLIWKDAVNSQGEVGALSFDPLYNAQDTQIVGFKIGKPEYGEGNLNIADVAVTFKNMGNDETVLFRLEQNAAKVWKISEIYYPGNDESSSSLKDILSQ